MWLFLSYCTVVTLKLFNLIIHCRLYPIYMCRVRIYHFNWTKVITSHIYQYLHIYIWICLISFFWRFWLISYLCFKFLLFLYAVCKFYLFFFSVFLHCRPVLIIWMTVLIYLTFCSIHASNKSHIFIYFLVTRI